MRDVPIDAPEENACTLWRNGRICPGGDSNEVIDPGALVVREARIVWIGSDREIPGEFAGCAAYDLRQRWVTPGLVDCHTHLVYGSCRADEFAMRLSGATYAEIAEKGGGIWSTVCATRGAGSDALFDQAARRLETLLREGVTAIEIKSGYGLNLETERKMLQVARRLGEVYPVSVYATFLGAHAVPEEFAGRPDEYIEVVCDEMLVELHREGLVDAVDVFCERIGFTIAQAERVYDRAGALGLPVKMHAEQLSNMGGARLAARYHALSADHLEYLDEAAVAAMKEANTVAVLLPSAFYFLRETQMPPVDLLRKYGVPIAIATDSNPGTSPNTSLLLTMNMGCTLFRLTPREALLGVTRHAAQALGKSDRHGSLGPGRYADFCVWAIESLAELAYRCGFNPCDVVVRSGEITRDVSL